MKLNGTDNWYTTLYNQLEVMYRNMIVIYTSTKYFTYATVYLIDKIHSKAYNVCVTYVTIAKK